MSSKLVIFDVDGTLVDSQAHILASMELAFADAGLEMPAREVVLGIVGLSLPEAMVRLVPGIDAKTRDGLVDGYKNGFASLRAAEGSTLSPLYPGAREALDQLADRNETLLAIATGKSRRGMHHIVEMHGFGTKFQSIQTADDHPSKPHPSMIDACLAECGVSPADAVMVGDTAFDMEMARAAGVPALGVNWGYHPVTALTQSGAVSVLPEFSALVPWLDDFWGRV